MALKLRSKLPTTGPDYFWSADWQIMMEMHISHMLRYGLIDYLTIEPALAYKFEGELWGILVEKRVPYDGHWVIMRLNAMRSPSDFTREHTNLLVPGSDTVNRYNSKFRDSYQKKK